VDNGGSRHALGLAWAKLTQTCKRPWDSPPKFYGLSPQTSKRRTMLDE